MIEFDESKHDLVGWLLHKALLPPEKLEELIIKATKAGIKIISVEMPEWPPVEYPPLAIMMGSNNGNPFSGKFFTGVQPAVDLFEDGSKVRVMARKMRGSTMSEEAISYQFQLPIFNPQTHVRIRKWIYDRRLSIVDFWRSYYPQIENQLTEFSIIDVVNPDVEDVDENDTQFYPTTRVLTLSKYHILKDFASQYPPLEFNLTQEVSWIRSLDGKRWEARRQYAPQNKTWMGKNCFITRTVGGGQHTDVDKDPKTGYDWGPFMILKDDGKLVVWVTKFAVDLIHRSGLIINGVHVALEKKSGLYICRMVGHVNASEADRILKKKIEAALMVIQDKEEERATQLEENVMQPIEERSEDQPLSIAVTAGVKVYSPADVLAKLEVTFGRKIDLFGFQTSDKKIVALTSKGLEAFLRGNKTNRNKYVNDAGGRNYDCDNFSEQLRVDLQREYGINGVGIIWGDVHAWNFFVISTDNGIEIKMIEPQSDIHVTDLIGKYGVQKRCAVLL